MEEKKTEEKADKSEKVEDNQENKEENNEKSGNAKDEEQDDEVAIDLSKIKNIFKKKTQKTEHHVSEDKSEDNIDVKNIWNDIKCPI